jgi:hypothetical protein
MSKPHLQALEEALTRRGWRIVAVHPGNDEDVSASWEVQRSTGEPSLFIDFEGLDDTECLALEESYGCHVRGSRKSSLYFRPVNKSRLLWEPELAEFIRSLGNEDQVPKHDERPGGGLCPGTDSAVEPGIGHPRRRE